MKLGKIIKYLDKLSWVKLWNMDANLMPDINGDTCECVFNGLVLDIPWVYLDYYLDENSGEAGAIEASYVGGNKAYLSISLHEPKKKGDK